MSSVPNIKRIIQERDEARERVRQLEEVLYQLDNNDDDARKFNLTRTERIIFSALKRWKVVSKDQLMTLIYSLHEDPPNPKVLTVYIWKMRRKGVRINTIYDFGWALDKSMIE